MKNVEYEITIETNKDHDMVDHGHGFDYEYRLWIVYMNWTQILDLVWI